MVSGYERTPSAVGLVFKPGKHGVITTTLIITSLEVAPTKEQSASACLRTRDTRDAPTLMILSPRGFAAFSVLWRSRAIKARACRAR